MGTTQWVLLGIIVALLIAHPILMFFRNKRENEKVKTQSDSIKKGDKVLTTSGIYGTVVEIKQEGNGKVITIETGSSKNKGYISIDAFAIYTVLTDKPVESAKEEVVETSEPVVEAAPFEKPAKKNTTKKK